MEKRTDDDDDGHEPAVVVRVSSKEIQVLDDFEAGRPSIQDDDTAGGGQHIKTEEPKGQQGQSAHRKHPAYESDAGLVTGRSLRQGEHLRHAPNGRTCNQVVHGHDAQDAEAFQKQRANGRPSGNGRTLIEEGGLKDPRSETKQHHRGEKEQDCHVP